MSDLFDPTIEIPEEPCSICTSQFGEKCSKDYLHKPATSCRNCQAPEDHHDLVPLEAQPGFGFVVIGALDALGDTHILDVLPTQGEAVRFGKKQKGYNEIVIAEILTRWKNEKKKGTR